jgi:hypothetical protein
MQTFRYCWDITPYSPLKSTVISQDQINSILGVCSSETAVDFQWTTRRYIAEDRTLHNHRCENLLNCSAVVFVLSRHCAVVI